MDQVLGRVLDVKAPLQLFQFVDKYYDGMSSESRMKLLGEVLGAVFLKVDDDELSKGEFKLELAQIFRSNFKLHARKEKPILLFIFPLSTFVDDELIQCLEMPTTPEQIDFMRWIIFNASNPREPRGGYDQDTVPPVYIRYILECHKALKSSHVSQV